MEAEKVARAAPLRAQLRERAWDVVGPESDFLRPLRFLRPILRARLARRSGPTFEMGRVLADAATEQITFVSLRVYSWLKSGESNLCLSVSIRG